MISKQQKLFVFVLGFLMIGAWTCNAGAATATGSFNYDFTTDPPCNNPTVTKNCIDHFTIFDITDAPQNVALTSVTPSTTVSTTGPTTLPFSFKVGAPYGNRTWVVQAVALDKNGVAVSSVSSAPATVNVKPGAPAAFVVNLN